MVFAYISYLVYSYDKTWHNLSVSDFPNSEWVCSKKNITITVDELCHDRAIYITNDTTYYLRSAIQFKSSHIILFQISEKDFNEYTSGTLNDKKRVFSGNYKMDDKKLIITAQRGYFDYEFWGEDDVQEMRLEFIRTDG